jgi:tetratricopeptide (TPR) repeat protein
MKDEVRPHHILGMCLLLLVLTVAVFWSVGGYKFISYDDGQYIVENRIVQDGLTWEGFRWAFVTDHASNWHPLTWLSHMLDVELFDLDAGKHHYSNLVFHAINAVLLFLVLWRMTRAPWRSWMVAALFAVHPLHVESVAWVAERKDVLSGFFWFLTMGAYLLFVKRSGVVTYCAVLLLFSLGLMAKPMLVTLPFVLLLLDYWPLGRWRGRGPLLQQHPQNPSGQQTAEPRLILEKVPLFALAGLSSFITYFIQQRSEAVSLLEATALSTRIENAVYSYGAYIGKMVWPLDLAFFYPYPESSLPGWKVAASLFMILALSLFFVRKAGKYPYLLVGWLWFLGTLVPVIGLIQVGLQGMADRYTYIPLTGVFIVICWGAYDLLSRWKFRKVVIPSISMTLLIALVGISRTQTETWENNVALYTHALKVTANNYLAHTNLAKALVQQDQYDEALTHLLLAQRISPVDPTINYALGVLLVSKKDYQGAMVYLRKAAVGSSQQATVYVRMGEASEGLRDYSGAKNYYQQALRTEPDNLDALNNMGIVHARLGQHDEAVQYFREAMKVDPTNDRIQSNLKRALAERSR